MKRNRLRKRASLVRLLWQDRNSGGNASGSSVRFRPQVEHLEQRRLLAVATDLATIGGRVFDDLTGDGYDPGEEIAGAQLTLYLDDGDGVFDPDGGDTSVETAVSDAAGLYEFTGLTAGDYFVLQPEQTVAERTLQRSVSPQISIDADAAQGRIVLSIDSFDTTVQSVRDETNDGVPVTSSVAAPEVIGGERDLFVNKTSENGAIQLSVNDPLLPDLLSFDSQQFGDGVRRVIWDGVDGDATTIDDSGLAATDLTSGDEAAGVRLQIGADLAGGAAVVRIYSDDEAAGTASRFSEATIPIPATGGLPSSAEFIPFTDFIGSGGGADFTQVGAIELEISGESNVNGTVELVGAIGPTIFTHNFANFESADLSLTKTVDDDRPSVGQDVTFTVTVTNSGPDSAAGVVVSDPLPSGFSFENADASQGTYDATTGRWDVGTLANDATATISLVATVTDAEARTNTAEIIASDVFDPDSTPGNNEPEEDDQASVSVMPVVADLSLTKTISDATPNVGSEVTFVVTVQNAGPDTATEIVVSDSFPDNVDLLSSDPSQGEFDDVTGLWTVGTLASEGQAALTLRGRVTASGTGTNTAEITAARPSDPDSTPGNNIAAEDDQDSVSFTPPVADLSLTKTVDDPAAGVGETVTFDIALANAGPDTATGIVVTDTLSDGLRFISATPSVGSYDSATGLWTIDSLADEATATLRILAEVESAAAQSNTAEVTAVAEFDPDSTPGNDVPAEDDQAVVTVVPPSADLSLTKTVSDAAPGVGSDVTFTLVVANAGPNAADDIVVGDTLPAGMSLVAAEPNRGTYNAASGRWTIPTLAANGSAQLLLTATADVPGETTNTAEILASSLPDPDSTPGNNDPDEDDFASVALSPELVDLALAKSFDEPAPNVGDSIAYLLSLTNEGPSTATGVAVTDALPEGVTFEAATASQGTYDGTTGIWSVGEIAPGITPTLRLEVTVGRTAGATNTAEVTAVDQPDADSTPGNGEPGEDDIASVAFITQSADLSLTKTVDTSSPNRNDMVRFTVTLSNAGPDDATAIAVRELLPAGLTFISATPSSGSYDPVDGLWTVPALAADNTATLNITTTATSPEPVVNTAEIVAAPQFDPDSTPGNGAEDEDDIASVVVTPPLVDVSVAADVDNTAPVEGEVIQITFTTSNAGPATATGLVLSTDLPEGLTLLTAQPTSGTFNPVTGRWTVDSLEANDQAELVLTLRVDVAGPRQIPLQLTELDQFDIDSTPGNDVESEDDQTTLELLGPRVLSKRLFLAR